MDDWDAVSHAAPPNSATDPSDAVSTPWKHEPLTEHEALGQAIFALSRTPNVYLGGDYANISEFLTVLGEAYEKGAERERSERAQEENLRKEAHEDERRRWIRAFPAQSLPEPEETREVEIEPEM